MSLIIEESGLSFGPFPPATIFHMEVAPLVSKMKPSVKMVEFVWSKGEGSGQQLIFVEAKSSIPQGEEKLAAYMEAIREKFSNAVSLLLAIGLGRHGNIHDDSVSASFKGASLATAKVKFVLVVKGVPKEYLPPFNEQLQKCCKALMRLFRVEAVVVVNEMGARKIGLIQ